MVLNKNPENYFAEIEQSAFSPAHMTPGVEASPDKMLQVLTSCSKKTWLSWNTIVKIGLSPSRKNLFI